MMAVLAESRRWIGLAAAAVALISVATLAIAQEAGSRISLTAGERAWLAANPRIRFAPAPNYPPVEFFDETGAYVGITADFVALMQTNLGIQFEVVRLKDWAQVVAKTKDREVDMWGAAAKTDERDAYMNFSRPYIRLPAVIIVRKEVEADLTLGEMAGKKIAAIRDYASHKYIEESFPDVGLITVPDILTGLRMVSFGAADAIVATNAAAIYYIEKQGFTNLRVAGESGFEWRLRFAARNDWPVLAGILQKGLDAISEEEKRAIYRKWISLQMTGWRPSRETIVGAIFLTVAVLLCAILAWSIVLQRQVRLRTAELSQELAERKILEGELVRAKAVAESASLAKSRFLASMSHDLRTPLNSILGFSEFMQLETLGPIANAKYGEYIGDIGSSARLLLSLIEEILDVARLEAGTTALEEEKVPLGPLVAEAVRMMAPLADGAGVTLIDQASASLPDVLADPSHLKRVVLNLLTNAVKFTPEGGSVRLLGGRHDDGVVAVSVIDTGPGISQDDLAFIFEPFHRGDSVVARETEGTGLGLPLANGFMKLHGGGIDIACPPEGGTTATLWLPPERVAN
jgi:two-component system, NarL family, sensor histidine kinase EvgS